MTQDESDEGTPAPLFEEKEPEERAAQEAPEEELPQPIRGGYFDRMAAKLRKALQRRSS
jgi:hypothetical protein